MDEQFSRRVARVKWEDEHDKILSVRFNKNADVDETDAIELIDFREKNFLKTNRLILIDMREAKHVSQEARHQFSLERSTSDVYAMALLVQGGVKTAIVSMFIEYAKFSIPTKMFSDEDKAMEWLRSMKP